MAQDVEPFDYQKTNNMDEHKQIVDKVNEIVNVINDANLDGIPQIQSDVSTLKSDVANLESDVGQNTTDIAGLDGDVDSLSTKVMAIESDISSLESKDSEMANDIETNETAITTLNGKVIKSVSATVPSEGKLRTTITLEDNSVFATDDTILGLIATGGVQIISTTTARAFKLRFTLTDGTYWDTNDFVIPEGGGTDVTVTSVSIVAGSTANTFKISIGLSDGEPIESNDYPFPTVPVASTATAGIVKVGSGLTITDDGTLSVTPAGVPVATATTAGIVKIGANINVTADGTISVTFPSQPDLSPYLTKSEASTTYVTQTVATSTYATKSELSELTGQMMNSPENVIGIGITTSANTATVNGKNANIINSISGTVDDNNNLIITINGVSGSGIPLPKSDTTIKLNNLIDATFQNGTQLSPTLDGIHGTIEESEKIIGTGDNTTYLSTYNIGSYGTSMGSFRNSGLQLYYDTLTDFIKSLNYQNGTGVITGMGVNETTIVTTALTYKFTIRNKSISLQQYANCLARVDTPPNKLLITSINFTSS